MVTFRWISTFAGLKGSGLMAGLSDMLLVERPEGRFLLTVNGEGGGLQVLSVGSRTLTQIEALRYDTHNEKAGLNAPRQITEITMNGLAGLAVSGNYRPYLLGAAAPSRSRTTNPASRDLREILGRANAVLLTGDHSAQRFRGLAGNDTLVGGDYHPATTQVFRLYQAALARAPDEAGQFGWAEALEAGTRTLAQAAKGFVESTEFKQRFGGVDDTGFVRLLYRNVLDREPDAAGLASWVNGLKRGLSRAEVLIGFSESTEFKNKTMADALMSTIEGHQQSWLPDVFRLYRAVLGRNPDMGGLTNWTKLLAEGLDYLTVVKSFIGSQEFQKIYGGATTGEFVTLLYRNVLGRAPDAGGFANWTNAIDNGMPREKVVAGFAQSTEFIRTSTINLRAWGKAAYAADDEFHAGSGRNVLFGGLGRDTFVFAVKDKGHHQIAGCEAWDDLVLQGFGYADVSGFRAALTVAGQDVTFFDQGTAILFKNTDLATVLASDLYLI